MPLKGGHENVAVVPASVALIQDHPSKIVGQWSVKKKNGIFIGYLFVKNVQRISASVLLSPASTKLASHILADSQMWGKYGAMFGEL